MGCSSGEEPYTLAIQILNYFGEKELPVPVEIIGTDISNQMLQTAVKANYRENAIRRVGDKLSQKYFTQNGRNFVLNENVKKMVKFGLLNLNNRENMMKLGQFDLVLCRNILIYFSTESKKQAVETLYEMVNPGGFMFIGYSESLHGIKHDFKLVHFLKALGYKK